MSTNSNAVSSNGKAKETKPELSKFAVSADKTETVKPEKILPFEERMHKLNQLFELQGNYVRLQESLTKLKTFKFKKDGDYASLVIRDNARGEFNTGNHFVIEEVTKILIQIIEGKLKELEPKLTW